MSKCLELVFDNHTNDVYTLYDMDTIAIVRTITDEVTPSDFYEIADPQESMNLYDNIYGLFSLYDVDYIDISINATNGIAYRLQYTFVHWNGIEYNNHVWIGNRVYRDDASLRRIYSIPTGSMLASLVNVANTISSMNVGAQIASQSLNGNNCEYHDGDSVTVYGRVGTYVVNSSFSVMVNDNQYTVMYRLENNGAFTYVPEALLTLVTAP